MLYDQVENILIRHFEAHGMGEWLLILLVFGTIIAIIASIFNGRKLMVLIPSGYIIGFVLAWCFNYEWIDIHGTRMDAFYIIWTITMLVSIGTGIIWGITPKLIKCFRGSREDSEKIIE